MLAAHSRWISVWVTLVGSFHAGAQQTVRVDDAQAYSLSNPSGIQFFSGWSSSPAVDQHYKGTYTSSQSDGDRIMFVFRGGLLIVIEMYY